VLRGRIIFCSVLLAVAALVVAAWLSFREPRAGGEPLSYWLKLGVSPDALDPADWKSPESEAAIREIGIKAIPTLLAKLRATDGPWKEKFYDWLNKQDLYKFEATWEHSERAEGLYGFMVLGTNALPARPELESLFWNTNTCWAAAGALGQLGLAALPTLRSGFTNQEMLIREAALFGTNPTNLAVLTLRDMHPLLHDPEYYISVVSFSRLMKFSSRDEAAALVMDVLQTNRTRLRVASLNQLGRVNLNTNKIVPVLVELVSDPDPNPRFRIALTNAFKRLDPGAAAAAGINTNPPPVPIGRPGGPRQRSLPSASATNALPKP
jgi:hypothetical protein